MFVFFTSFLVLFSSEHALAYNYNNSCSFDSPGSYIDSKTSFYSYNYELDQGDGTMGKRGLVEDTYGIFDYALNVSGNWSEVFKNVFLHLTIDCDETVIHEAEIEEGSWRDGRVDFGNTSILRFSTYFNITEAKAGCSYGGNFYGKNPENVCTGAFIDGLGLAVTPLGLIKVYSEAEYLVEKQLKSIGKTQEEPKEKQDYSWMVLYPLIALLLIVILTILIVLYQKVMYRKPIHTSIKEIFTKITGLLFPDGHLKEKLQPSTKGNDESDKDKRKALKIINNKMIDCMDRLNKQANVGIQNEAEYTKTWNMVDDFRKTKMKYEIYFNEELNEALSEVLGKFRKTNVALGSKDFDKDLKSARAKTESEEEVIVETLFWFAWAAFHPDTGLYQAN
jgi:hypothetical protein